MMVLYVKPLPSNDTQSKDFDNQMSVALENYALTNEDKLIAYLQYLKN